MRLMRSPGKGLEVEPVLGEAGVGQGAADQVGPALGPADVDVALGDVRDPVAQSGEVVGAAYAVTEPGAGVAATARQAEVLEPLLAAQDLQLVEEQGLV